MQERSAAASAGKAYGLGIAAIVTTTFGFIWFGWGLGDADFASWPLWIALYVAAIVLAVSAVAALRSGKSLLRRYAAGDDTFRRTMRPRFLAITVAEFAGCAIVVILCLVFHRWDLLAAGISIVVGLHFIPLARLFEMPIYYWTAAGIVAVDAAALATQRGDAISVAAGIGTGGVLWATAVYVLFAASRSRA